MKKQITFLLSAVVLLLTSCEKDIHLDISRFDIGGSVNPNTVISHFYQPTLEYIKLPPGRHFIYKDSASGTIDSVIVTQSSIETEFQAATSGFPGSPAAYYDVYKLTLTKFEAVPPTNQTWFQGISQSHHGGFVSATIIDSTIYLIDQQFGGPAFWYPFTPYEQNIYAFLPTMIIEGVTYSNVHICSSSNGRSPMDTNYRAAVNWWVKGIGNIKRQINTYNTVKTSLLLRYG